MPSRFPNTAEVLQKNDYYPFGLLMAESSDATGITSKNRYKYNGKEFVPDSRMNWYDYGARMYDPQLGRWHVMDPIIQFSSPYVSMGNNPIKFIDRNGMAVTAIEGGYRITGDDIIIYMSNLKSASSGELSWNNFYEGLEAASKNPDGKAFKNTIDAPIIFNKGNSSDFSYNREGGGVLVHNNNARAEYLETKKQEDYDNFMSDFYKKREELSRGTFKMMGLFVSPIIIAEAPAFVSLKYAGVKLGVSALNQKITTGRIDYADLISDGLLTPGAGAVASGIFNVYYIDGNFVFSSPESLQQALLVTGSNYLFGTANGGLSKLGTKHLGNSKAANIIYQGVASFATETIENISTNVGQ